MAREFIYGFDSTRKYDIDFVNWDGIVQGLAGFDFGTLSKKNTGVMKATNRFLKILLTLKGSDPFDVTAGTYFDDLQYQGNLNDTDLGTYVSTQIGDALDQVQAIQALNDFPDDENITAVDLTGITRPTADSVVISASITTESGKGVTIRVPVVGG